MATSRSCGPSRSSGAARSRPARPRSTRCASILVSAPDGLRGRFRNFSKSDLIERCSRLRPGGEGRDASVKTALRRLTRHCKMLNEELAEADAEIEALVHRCTPALLELDGVGPGVAATLLVAAGDNPNRLRSEASFAHMAGAAPLRTGSGLTSGRHRLNRGGNRQANNTLWTIVVVRIRMDQRTKDYVAHRTTEAKTKKEIIRCLIGKVACEVHQVLTRTTAINASVAQT